MVRLIAFRAVQSLVALLGLMLLIFLMSTSVGDPVRLMLPPDATADQIEEVRRLLGLDDPVLTRYGRFLYDILRGDFGFSYRQHQPVLGLIVERLPATLELGLAALAISVTVGIPLGIIAAVRRGGAIDAAAMAVALVGQSVPTFWLGLLLIFGVALRIPLLPSSGRDGLLSLVLPAITVAAFPLCSFARLTRSVILEQLTEDYVRTARSKGMPNRRVVLYHVMRNSLIPLVSLAGLQSGVILGGAVVTESIFGWPGLGLLLIQAIYGRDFPVIQVTVLMLATGIMIVNFLVDIAYTYLDPRVRYG